MNRKPPSAMTALRGSLWEMLEDASLRIPVAYWRSLRSPCDYWHCSNFEANGHTRQCRSDCPFCLEAHSSKFGEPKHFDGISWQAYMKRYKVFLRRLELYPNGGQHIANALRPPHRSHTAATPQRPRASPLSQQTLADVLIIFLMAF